MSTLTVQVEPLEGVENGVVVHLDGALDQPTRDTFLGKLKAVLNEGKTRCVLDMQRVSYANSTAIGDLVNQFDTFRDAGGELVLLNPQRKVYIVIEMVGLNSVLPIFNTLEEARSHLSASAGAPAARPSSASREEVAAPAAAGPASFPLKCECVGCGVTVEFAQVGRFRCPQCGAVYGVDRTGRVTGAKPHGARPIEMSIPCQPHALKAFRLFVGALPTWDGYTEAERHRLDVALGEVCDVILERAYEGNRESSFHVLVVCREDELALRVADHGKSLDASAFPAAAAYMTEFEHRPHPARGNYLRMIKRAR